MKKEEMDGVSIPSKTVEVPQKIIPQESVFFKPKRSVKLPEKRAKTMPIALARTIRVCTCLEEMRESFKK